MLQRGEERAGREIDGERYQTCSEGREREYPAHG